MLDGLSVEVGLRRAGTRRHLLVSRPLGKHIPVAIDEVEQTGQALGAAIASRCDTAPIVLGFAETATALGHWVAAGANSPYYLHSTRRPVSSPLVLEFDESHSHAVRHQLVIDDPAQFDNDLPLALVDDELSTGRTALNAISALHAKWPRPQYLLATLLDARSDTDIARLGEAVSEMGASIDTVALSAVDPMQLPAPTGNAGDDATGPVTPDGWSGARVHFWSLEVGGRSHAGQGWTRADETVVRSAAALAAQLPVAPDARTLVLGDEELMYLPQLMARAIGRDVRTSTATRSPAVVRDVAGYPLRTVLEIDAPEEPGRPKFAYNVMPSRQSDPGNAPGFEHVVFVSPLPSDVLSTCGIPELLRQAAGVDVHLISVCLAAASALSRLEPMSL